MHGGGAIIKKPDKRYKACSGVVGVAIQNFSKNPVISTVSGLAG